MERKQGPKQPMSQAAAAFLSMAMALCSLSGGIDAFAAEVQPPVQAKEVDSAYDNRQELEQAGYRLAWNDEFEGNDLDFGKWDFQLGTKASDEGAPENWGNNEQEYYTEENYKVEDGVLTITAKKEEKEGKNYTSTRIRTMKDDGTCLYAAKYGRVEARMKLPREEGLWPAFWMLPADTSVYGTWAASGEIDILEAKGRLPDRVNGTIHFGSQWPDNLYLGDEYRFDDSTDIADWHLYSVEWEPGKISWMVDDEVYFTAEASLSRTSSPQDKFWGRGEDSQENYAYGAPFDMPFYIILNLAVGGNYDWEANPANAEFPASMEVDYVRVWQKDANAYQALEDAHPKGEEPYKENGGNCVYNGFFTSGEKQLGYWHANNAIAEVKAAGSAYRVDVESSGSGPAQLSQGGILLESSKQYQMSLKLSGSSPVRVTVAKRDNSKVYLDQTFQPVSRFGTYSASFAVPKDDGSEDAQITIETAEGGSFLAKDVELTCFEYWGTKDAPAGSTSGNDAAVIGEDYTIQLARCNWSILFLRAVAAGAENAKVMVNGVVLDADAMKGMVDKEASTIQIPASAVGDGDYTIALILEGWNAVSLVDQAVPSENPPVENPPENPSVNPPTENPPVNPPTENPPENPPVENPPAENPPVQLPVANPPASLTKKELAAAQLALIKPIKSAKTSNQLTWNRVKGADGYIIYAASCNANGEKSALKKIKTITSGSGGTYTQKGLKSGTWYKYRIDAYRTVNGKKEVIAKSFLMHARTMGKNSKFTNPTGVKASKTKVSLKKGNSVQLAASLVIPKGKKTKYHRSQITYIVSDPDIVKVSVKGKITGKKKGQAAVYAFSQNGCSKKIAVTVK